jgi:hypothetical protein
MKLIFFDRFSKNTQIQSLIIIQSVGAELLHSDGYTTEITVAFRNFANASDNEYVKTYVHLLYLAEFFLK